MFFSTIQGSQMTTLSYSEIFIRWKATWIQPSFRATPRSLTTPLRERTPHLVASNIDSSIFLLRQTSFLSASDWFPFPSTRLSFVFLCPIADPFFWSSVCLCLSACYLWSICCCYRCCQSIILLTAVSFAVACSIASL